MVSAGSVIAVLGGTGALGSGLARRWARAGHPIRIGTRDPERASELVVGLDAQSPDLMHAALSYEAAAGEADLCVLTVPFASHTDVLKTVREAARGKILVDCTVPLRPPKVGTVQLPEEGSAAQRAQALLGEEVKVVSAFQNVSAALAGSDTDDIDCDILVSGNDDDACLAVADLVAAAGMRAVRAGPLANAAAAEALTSVLIQINRRYKAKHAGLRITGLGG